MIPAVTHWGAEALWLALEPQLPGVTLEVLPEVDSSNSELLRRARQGQCAPCVLVAEHQSAGRGRMGRIWHDQAGDSLMYSLGLLLRPKEWAGLSLVVGISIAESLNARMGAKHIGVKWPNDLWCNQGRKLAGTLIETASVAAAQGEAAYGAGVDASRFVVIGTGINVRSAPTAASPDAPPPIWLQALDAQWEAPAALAAVLPALVRDVLQFAEHGFAPFQARFDALDVLRDRPVHLSDGSQGVAAGVSHDGQLLLRTASGIHPVLSGDVSVRPQDMAFPADHHMHKG